jgi:hypothetical protein
MATSHTPACHERLVGRARPTAAGTYSAVTHDFGMTFTAKF